MKTWQSMVVAFLTVVSGRAVSQEAFYSVRLTDLSLKEGSLPVLQETWRSDWRLRAALRPRATVQGPGEAYISIDWPGRGGWGRGARCGCAIRS